MKKTFALTLAALALLGTGAYAQDYIYPFRFAFVDIPVASACGVSKVRAASAVAVYDHNPWITFTCEDGTVVLRRYLNESDNDGVAPIPVYVIAPKGAPAAAPVTVACTVPGMVTSIHGGCVPTNHPDAPR